MDVNLTYYELQHQQLESTLRSLQDKVAAIEVMKADTWKLAACFFVFLMQVGNPTILPVCIGTPSYRTITDAGWRFAVLHGFDPAYLEECE